MEYALPRSLVLKQVRREETVGRPDQADTQGELPLLPLEALGKPDMLLPFNASVVSITSE